MDKRRRKQPKISTTHDSEEVSSIEWEFINMTEQEEDLIYRMYRLVGDRVWICDVYHSGPYIHLAAIIRSSAGKFGCRCLRENERWALIAGRIPGRKPEEIERFWIMRHGEGFAGKKEGRDS